jgi:cytidyltransferase-like protein
MKKVLVGGVFNRIHKGHLYFFKKAKKYGDFLTVVIATDKTAKRTKDYPVLGQEERKKNLEKIKIIDKVLIGDEKDFFRVVEKEKPDFIVLGYDQRISEKELEEKIRKRKLECKVMRIRDFLKGYSTRKLMEAEETEKK